MTDAAADLPVPPGVSCIIVAFHRPKALAHLVEMLTDDDIELVIVNVETDPAIATLATDHLHLPLPGNPGYAAAVNAGAEKASAPTVVFMNDDAGVDAECLRSLASVVEEGGGRHVVVPAVFDEGGTWQPTIAALPTPRSLLWEWAMLPDLAVPGARGLPVQKWRRPVEPETVEAASAVVVATPRDLLLRVPLPETYFLYWEEHEWYWRLRSMGVELRYHPELRCTHDGGRADLRPEKSRLMARNALRCVRRTQGRRAAALAFPAVLAWNTRLVVTALVRAMAGRFEPAQRSLLRARVAGLAAAWGAWREVVAEKDESR